MAVVAGASELVLTVIAEPLDYPPEALSLWQGRGPVAMGPFTRNELLSQIGAADVLVVRFAHKLDAELIAAAPRLQAIASATTGLDHIDLEAARCRSIEVVSLRGETEFLRTISSTAELTIALMLALLRNIVPAVQSVRGGMWDRNRFRGCDLKGRRLGLVGCGRVGELCAGYAAAFGMVVAAYDPFRSQLPDQVHRAGSLRELFASSSIVAVLATLGADTINLIGRSEFNSMPRGGFLVNTSRGAIVDEHALVEALASGRLAGAAVDVIANEPAGGDKPHGPLINYAQSHDNLIITPHIGGATFDSMATTELFVARKALELLDRHGCADVC